MAEIVGVVSSVIAFTGVAQKTIAPLATSDLPPKSATTFSAGSLMSKQHLEDFKCTIQNLTDRLKPSENASGLSIRERLSWVVKGKSQAKEDSTKIEEFEQLLAKWLSLDT
ncbi:hypothetical protein FRC19_006960, partial [Serendipita sp. 401]